MNGASLARAAGLIAGIGVLGASCTQSTADSEILPAAAPFTSGSRLRAQYLDVDGLRLFWRLFDKELGTECTLGAWAQGGLRYCLPVKRRSASTEVFSDAKCSVPLYDPPFYCPTRPDYVLSGTPPNETISLTGAEAPPASVYGVLPGMGCVNVKRGATSGGNVGRPFYFVGREVPMTAFVAIHEEIVDTGSRLAILAHRGADGMLFRAGSWDTRWRQPVELGADDAMSPWVPARTALLAPGLFHDEACTQEVATSPDNGTAEPTAAVTRDHRGELVRVHRIGDRIADGLHVLDVNGACVAQLREGRDRKYKVGTAIPKASFETSRIVEVGGGRLHVLYRAGVDGLPIEPIGLRGNAFSAGFRDTARAEPCSMHEIPGGGFRCLPASHVSAFARSPGDPALAGGSDVVIADYERTGLPHAVTYLPNGDGCDDGSVTMPIVYLIGPKFHASASVDYYLTGAIVPLEAFAAATARID